MLQNLRPIPPEKYQYFLFYANSSQEQLTLQSKLLERLRYLVRRYSCPQSFLSAVFMVGLAPFVHLYCSKEFRGAEDGNRARDKF